MTFNIFPVIFLMILLSNSGDHFSVAFSCTCTSQVFPGNPTNVAFSGRASPLSILKNQQVPLQAKFESQDEVEEEEARETSTVLPLPPATASDNITTTTTTANISLEDFQTTSPTPTSASVATMISRENKRILIEELGFKRSDVERLRFDIVTCIIESRTRRPSTSTTQDEGLPASWCRSEEDLAQERMASKLEQESKYPFKLPLLGLSLVLFGKGFGDALITVIKVNTNFPGASLMETFLNVPVLLIDGFCILLGAVLGWWTWNNMK